MTGDVGERRSRPAEGKRRGRLFCASGAAGRCWALTVASGASRSGARGASSPGITTTGKRGPALAVPTQLLAPPWALPPLTREPRSYSDPSPAGSRNHRASRRVTQTRHRRRSLAAGAAHGESARPRVSASRVTTSAAPPQPCFPGFGVLSSSPSCRGFATAYSEAAREAFVQGPPPVRSPPPLPDTCSVAPVSALLVRGSPYPPPLRSDPGAQRSPAGCSRAQLSASLAVEPRSVEPPLPRPRTPTPQGCGIRPGGARQQAFVTGAAHAPGGEKGGRASRTLALGGAEQGRKATELCARHRASCALTGDADTLRCILSIHNTSQGV